ncbi:MAG: hypothetical protein V4523_05045 [Pseudomonadota bacterium]
MKEPEIYHFTKGEGVRIPSPGRCIYCGDNQQKLRDEHVFPYSLAGHSMILEKCCCETCQNIIQKYEQEVLKKQLGLLRARVEAPTRRPKDRASHAEMHFIEVNESGRFLRDLGTRKIPINEAPVVFSLWRSPMPRRLRFHPLTPQQEYGMPWSFVQHESGHSLCRTVAQETGAKYIALRAGTVNRLHYLRSLAKTAHAFAVAKLGMDAFDPYLLDLILGRSDDVSEFVGDDPFPGPIIEISEYDSIHIYLGETIDDGLRGLVTARIVLYPVLNTPPHLVVVGKAKVDIAKRFAGEI